MSERASIPPVRGWRAWMLAGVLLGLLLPSYAATKLPRDASVEAQRNKPWTAMRLDRRLESEAKRFDLLRAAADKTRPIPARVAFTGDSTVSFYPPGETLPYRTSQILNSPGHTGPPISVLNLAYIGAGAVAQFFWVDRIAATRPDLMIWEINLMHFSRWWTQDIVRPELAGWMAFERWGALFSLPLFKLGVRLDEFLLSQLIVHTGSSSHLQELTMIQKQVRHLRPLSDSFVRDHFQWKAEQQHSLESDMIKRERLETANGKATDQGEAEHLGTALEGIPDDHPVLPILEAGLRYYAEHGVDVLVYLTPINLGNLEAVGILEPERLVGSVEQIRRVVEGTGTRFLDLHALLPSDHFGDLPHHYRHRPDFDGVGPLAERIAKAIRFELEGDF